MQRLTILFIFILIALSFCFRPVSKEMPIKDTENREETQCLTLESETIIKETDRPEPISLPAEMVAETEPETEAEIIIQDEILTCDHAFVYSTREGFLYHLGKLDEEIEPASVTKLMTAHLVVSLLNESEQITVGDEISLVKPNSSTAWLQKGAKLSKENLLSACLIPSGCDAAYVLAAAGGRLLSDNPSLDVAGAVGLFVDEMNREAERIGMKHTYFSNPDGYHETGHKTTMEDLAVLSGLIVQNEEILKITSVFSYEALTENGAFYRWENTNLLLDPASPFFMKEVIGLKTGSTPEAGYCLLSAVRRTDDFLIVGVFGSETSESRFRDSIYLIKSFWK